MRDYNDRKTYQQVIRLNRDNGDYLLPRNFFNMLVCRFFPVMALIYLVSIFCIAISSGETLRYLFHDNTAYLRALLVVLWCAGPAVVWIFLVSNPVFTHVAGLWFKILAGLLQLTICLSYFLFPEMEVFGMRSYLILSFPAFFLMYYLLVLDPLPLEVVYPLNAFGVCALIFFLKISIV